MQKFAYRALDRIPTTLMSTSPGVNARVRAAFANHPVVGEVRGQGQIASVKFVAVAREAADLVAGELA